MASHIASYIVLATVFTTCLCLPLKTEKDSDKNEIASSDVDKIVLSKDIVTDFMKEAFSQVSAQVPEVTMSDKDEHMIVRRSKRAGIISGTMCPEDQWRMPSGECAPCQGQNHPGCPVVDDDYYNEVE